MPLRDTPASVPAPPQPLIPPEASPAEFTLRALVLGILLGIIFGASSLYLVLKVGLTVSASIPVAVISVALFRLWSKAGGHDATILEHNIVQTAGSAGESIAFGLGVTMPAILILGFDLEITRVLLVGLLGGLLGILMMIPLRRALIVKQHAELKYPEGTACAEVLKAGANPSGTSIPAQGSAAIFQGFGLGLLYKTLMSAFRCWKDVPEKILGPPLAGGTVAAEISPELLGVGYIIGPRISCIMAAGGILAALVLAPIIKFFGSLSPVALSPGTLPVSQMTPDDIRSAYILYIGAGAVAAGGLISLFRSLPLIWHGLREGLAGFGFGGSTSKTVLRTDLDLSMQTVAVGCLLLIAAIIAAPPLHMNLLGAALIVLFGFLFVTVSSRLTGEIGSSSNPISGMTVATLLLTCLVFLSIGWTGRSYYVTALSVGGIVCIAASNGGSTSQDLKTGFLLGATPRWQQMAILAGATASALILGPVLLGLNNTASVYVPVAQIAPGLFATNHLALLKRETLSGPQWLSDHKTYRVWQKSDAVGGPEGKYLVDESGAAIYLVDPGINGTHKRRPDGTEVRKFDAPKATLMSYIIKGILDRRLPWELVLFGVMISVVLELSGIPSLAFAVGVYLPVSASLPVFAGGAVRWLADTHLRHSPVAAKLNSTEFAAHSDRAPGVLLASGYIAGGAIAGIIIAFLAGVLGHLDNSIANWARAHNPLYTGPNADWLSLIPFLALAALLYSFGRRLSLPPASSRP